ncbi:hypothetical protein T01_15701 [Trichinella spiralis]|uniref:Uncharacterized protein n=1 Tax=Trichinella spiralis TaxID=6334 RepID=A0A0V1ARG1_TRISP|nr:hypothetical protein T01_15701 [Trichinella spiralis]
MRDHGVLGDSHLCTGACGGEALDCWHCSHVLTKFSISLSIFGHQLGLSLYCPIANNHCELRFHVGASRKVSVVRLIQISAISSMPSLELV